MVAVTSGYRKCYRRQPLPKAVDDASDSNSLRIDQDLEGARRQSSLVIQIAERRGPPAKAHAGRGHSGGIEHHLIAPDRAVGEAATGLRFSTELKPHGTRGAVGEERAVRR